MQRIVIVVVGIKHARRDRPRRAKRRVLTFQLAGVIGCLWGSALFALSAGVLSMLLPFKPSAMLMAESGSD
jgi:hypothetical protein